MLTGRGCLRDLSISICLGVLIHKHRHPLFSLVPHFTQKLWHHGRHAIVYKEHAIFSEELASFFESSPLALELGDADHTTNKLDSKTFNNVLVLPLWIFNNEAYLSLSGIDSRMGEGAYEWTR